MMFFFMQTAEAMMRFMPKDILVSRSEYIVVGKVQAVSDSRKTILWRGTKASVIRNELLVIESIKGSLSSGKTFFLDTLKFDGWMEDNVELPPVNSEVLLFLERDEKGNLKPVNGIQGVWKIDSDGKPRYGTMKEIRKIVKKQASKLEKSCSSKAFTTLLDAAEMQTQAGHYKEALETYRKVYAICSTKDIEEQMAWLMGEIGDDKNNKNGKVK
ncbi:hypothetical protein [Sulfurovum sp.]|uniref:hypothetical protein n=1 Tax=Sulfurovum sp. TaxID=1969726 RepID=UPI0025FCB6D7|nr:hypothetical protein [Sulfurovum sp.]